MRYLKNNTNEYICKTETDTENKLVVTKEKGEARPLERSFSTVSWGGGKGGLRPGTGHSLGPCPVLPR